MKTFAHILSIVTAAVILCFGFIIGMASLSEGYHPLYPLIDTQHSDKYSIRNFNAIKLGDTERQVMTIVGQPLYIELDSLSARKTLHYTGDGKLLNYSRSINERSYEDFAWYRSSLTFDSSNKVIAIDKGWSYD